MDKVKEIGALLLKHGFWIGCAVSALMAIGAWYQATSALSEQAKKQKDDIKSKAGAVQAIIRDATPHPNKTSLDGMELLSRNVALNVRDGWKKVYDLQREVLVWPEEFDPKFHRAVDNLRPIEIIPFPTPPDKEINPDFHRQYRDYILTVIPKLATIVGTEWKAVRQAAASGGSMPSSDFSSQFSSSSFGGADMPGVKKVEDKSIVHWNVANQQEIQNSHFGFAGRLDPPKTLEILYAQEDLWVLQTLMEIIRATNKGAEFYHESAIKDIDYVRIGRNAGGVSGQVEWVTAAADGSMGMAPGSSGGEMGRPGGSMGVMMNPMTMGSGAAAVAIDPAESRYVDANFKPLKASEVRSVLTTTTVNEKDAVLAVAKRMPVRMRVVMDQRRLPQFLSECANSRLPVEVKQVRINRPAASNSGAGGGGGYGGGGGGAQMPGMETTTFGSGMTNKGGGPDPNNITAELFGIIYIYNPPNDAQLGLDNPNKTASAGSAAGNLVAK